MTPARADEAARARSGSWIGWVFSFPAFLAMGLATVAVVTVSTHFNDPDLWWHLRMGQIIWNTHTIPVTDVFSFTAQGHAWTPHEWLAQLSIYAAWHWGGYTGLMVWLSVLASLLFIGVFVLCRFFCESSLVCFMGALVAWFFATVGLAIRPLMIGHVFLVLEMVLLEAAYRHSRRWLWLLPPLFALWVNCHGSYFFGAGVLAAYCIGAYASGVWGLLVSKGWDRQARRALVAASVACIAALCCNPVGARMLIYPLNTLFGQATGMNAVQEWMAPDLREGRTLGMLAVSAAILLIPLLRRSELWVRELLLLAAAFFLASQHLRMIFIFGIIAAPILARLIDPLFGKDQMRAHPIFNAILMLGCGAAMAAAFPSTSAIEQQAREKSPVAAVDYIKRAGLTGPMLNDYVFGGYLIWALPQEKVFIDGRGDVYDWTGVFQEYGRWATLSEDPARLLDKYKIRFCIFAADHPMVRMIEHLAGWRRVYADKVAIVLAR